LIPLPSNCLKECLYSELPYFAINTCCNERQCVTLTCVAVPVIVHCIEVDVLGNLGSFADVFEVVGPVVKEEDICFAGAVKIVT